MEWSEFSNPKPKLITLDTEVLESTIAEMKSERAALEDKVSDLEDTVAMLEAKVEEFEGARDEADHGGEPVVHVTHDDVRELIQEECVMMVTEDRLRELLEEFLTDACVTISF